MNEIPLRATQEADVARFDGGVALISPCGWGNLGDAAIVDSAIHAVRSRLVGTPLLALTLNPEDTEARHGVPAFTCSGFSRPYYGVRQKGDRSVVAPYLNGTANDERPPTLLNELRARTEALPVVHQAWVLARSARDDVRHRHSLERSTRKLRHIVVAGGGQLDDFWGGAFGHPYVLFRWARHAAKIGAKFSILSVGTGSLHTPLARFFVHRALDAASYRSFRDSGSRGLLGSPRYADMPVVPDLAYGFPIEPYRNRPQSARERPLVALLPIAYCEPRVWPVADQARYTSYIARVAKLALGVLESGNDLVLFGTDGTDNRSVADLHAELGRRATPELYARVSIAPVMTHQAMFAALAEASAVIASRLHGVLLSHLLGLPVLAISYERKVATLMRTMEQEPYCLSIDSFEPEAALARFSELMARRGELSSAILSRVTGFAREVNQQYDNVF